MFGALFALTSAVAGAAVGIVGPARPAAAASPALPGTPCPSFPADATWNTPITGLPVDPHSQTWLASMNASGTLLHPDFGPSGTATPYGIPWVASAAAPSTVVSFQYPAESDPGPYPFTASTPIEGGPSSGGDRHAIMVDTATCTLYELYDARYQAGGSTAGSGAIWNLNSDAFRPAGWTSSDAAGLPILPLLVNFDQASIGVMDHAIRMTASCTQQAYIWPARHQAGQANANCPPMGARFRLNAGYSPSGPCSTICQAVVQAMKTYGLIVADNGSNWSFQGTADGRWTYPDVDELKQIPASQFQAVDEACLAVNADSAQAYQPGTAGYAAHCGGGSPPTPGPNDCAFNAPTVGITPSGPGYLTVDSAGQVCASGGAPWAGDAAPLALAAPVKTIVATPDGGGYWLLGSDGGIFSYGDAGFYGSTGGLRLAAPVVSMAVTPDGRGYWLVAADGGVFTFGDGVFRGSTGGLHLVAPVVGMAVAPSGDGYWLVAADGGVFTFTGEGFYGSLGGLALNQPIVGMSSTPDGRGYTLVAADGGVFTFGDAHFYGSLGNAPPVTPVVDLAPLPGDAGYYLVDSGGQVFPFGPGG